MATCIVVVGFQSGGRGAALRGVGGRMQREKTTFLLAIKDNVDEGGVRWRREVRSARSKEGQLVVKNMKEKPANNAVLNDEARLVTQEILLVHIPTGQ